MPPNSKPIVKQNANLFTALYLLIQTVMGFIYHFIEYILYFVFIISDYAMTFGSYILTVSFLEKTTFPLKLVSYAIVFIRAALIIYGFYALFQLIFTRHTKDLFTRKNVSQCQGNINELNGTDKNPLCETAIYNGQSYIDGSPTTVQYNYNQINKANEICSNQLIYWIIFMSIFAIPASISTI
jgi:hypothetical protein